MAFEILARLGLNATGFHSGLKRAESSGVQFANTLKRQIAGAFTAGAAVQFVRSVHQAMDALGDLSDQSGLTTKDIQEFQAIAGKSGLDVAPLVQFTEKLREARREAQAGKADMRHLFNSMNIDPTRLDALSDPGELLRTFAAEFSKFDEESRNALAQQIGGAKIGGRLSSTLTAIGRGEKSGEIQFSESDVKAAGNIDNFAKSMARQSKVAYAKFLETPFSGLLGFGFQVFKRKAEAEARKEFQKPAPAPGELRTFTPAPPAPDKEKEPEPEPAERDLPSPSRFQQDVSALQRIGEQILGPNKNQVEQQQLAVQRLMEKHLADLKNANSNTFP